MKQKRLPPIKLTPGQYLFVAYLNDGSQRRAVLTPAYSSGLFRWLFRWLYKPDTSAVVTVTLGFMSAYNGWHKATLHRADGSLVCDWNNMNDDNLPHISTMPPGLFDYDYQP